THPEDTTAPDGVRRFVRYGSSPRGAQALMLGGKIRAALDRRYNVGFADIRETVLPALRHRLILNFEGEAEGKSGGELLREVLEAVPEVAADASLAS
ncbi:MAG: AAA family ATPase, partial [Planctomycetota bacterium]